ncbi:hypothetical protein [Streptomyces sp. NPDC046685]|uniref:hypothetical protein n=1 Tax=Streptomyces sp. NPDC046685 TaxID=3157202 RepID=UPI003403C8FA
MASVRTRRAAVLRDRTRTNRATARTRREIATAARRVRTGARALATHVLATGATRETVKGVVRALRDHAKKNGIKGRAARIRRTIDGRARQTVTVYRYTRAQVAAIVATYKPRKAEYKAVSAALAAA